MELLQDTQMNKADDYLPDLDRMYRKTTRDIEKEIASWYQRFATNNKVTMQEARKLLDASDLKELQWDLQEYIQMGERNALDPKWIKQMENASAKVHISRLESLKLQVQQKVEVLYGRQVGQFDKNISSLYKDTYYKNAWAVQQGFNVGWDLQSFDGNQLEKIMSKPWSLDGTTFSDRIWTNKAKLVSTLQTNLTRSIVQGKAPDQAIKEIAKLLGTEGVEPKAALYQAGRLYMTESAAFASIAQKDAFKALDVEKYEIVATLDGLTSQTCIDLDGETIDLKDYEVGITAPPFHPWCRTTTAPFFDDEFALGERAARDPKTGKTYYVPSDMKYPDWKKTFTDGGSKAGMMPVNPLDVAAAVMPKSFNEKIQAVKDGIQSNGGVITEVDIQSAGKLMQEELEAGRKAIKDQLDELINKKKSFNMESLDQKMLDVKSVRRGLRTPDEIGLPKDLTGDDLKIKLDELETNIMEQKVKIWDGGYDSLDNQISDLQNTYKGDMKANAAELKAKLSEIRTTGNGSIDVKGHLNNSRSPMRAVVTDAYDHYPNDWVDTSVKNSKLTPKKVNRGFYSHYHSEIAISDHGRNGSFRTSIHELGHRFERTVPGILDIEKAFYKRRTAGESLQWLGGNYDYSEKSRFDKFLSKYMGKDYKGTAYELVSMGFEYAYTQPTLLWTDEDYATWIYGILALY